VTAFRDLRTYSATIKSDFKEGIMKKLLIAGATLAALIGTPALAADMALKAPPPPPPSWSWTGFYVGLNAGYSVARDPFNQTSVPAGIGAVATSSIDSRVSPQGGIFGDPPAANVTTIVIGRAG
jgi:opacity protein-like surface antigen